MLRFLESQPPIVFVALGAVAVTLFVILVSIPRSVVGLALERFWLAIPRPILRGASRFAAFVLDFGAVEEPDGKAVGPGATPIRGRWERFRQHRYAQAGAVTLSAPTASTGALSDSGERPAAARGSLSDPDR